MRVLMIHPWVCGGRSRAGRWAGALLALVAGCGGSSSDTGNHLFTTAARRMGKVAGKVVDQETGAPLVGAQVQIGTQAVKVKSDGTFEADAVAGRVRVEVKVPDFLDTTRDVAVGGDSTFSLPFRMARKAPSVAVGRQAASLRFQDAELVVPAGAFSDGSTVALTYLPRAVVAAVVGAPQFVDADQVPRRVLATATLEGSEAPAVPVRVRVPVPTDASADSVTGFRINDNGDWGDKLAPASVSGGFAEFALSASGRFGVAVDARHADGSKVGYLIVDPGESGMSVGHVVTDGLDLATISQPLAVVDPQGSRLEIGPATRVHLESPAEDGTAPGSTGAARAKEAPYSGDATVTAGRVRAVVPEPMGTVDLDKPVRLAVSGRLGRFEARGTAFIVTTCASGSGSVDTLEVVDGTVDATFAGKTSRIAAGQAASYCTSCGGGKAPTCGPEPDAGVAPGALDGSLPASDGPSPLPDGGVLLVDASPALADGPVVARDAPLEASLPGADAPAPPQYDASAPPADASVVKADAPVIVADAPTAAALALAPPSSHDFGPVTVGMSLEFTFTLSNAGDADTGPLTCTAGGGNPGDFVVDDSSCPSILSPGQSCPVAVTFAPAAAGPRAATLGCAASPGGVATNNLMGTGVVSTGGGLVTSPPSVTWPASDIGHPAGEMVVSVQNMGTSPTGIPTAVVSGANPNDFQIISNLCKATLDPGASCNLYMNFIPTAAGARTGSVGVTASPGGSASTALAGTGNAATSAALAMYPAEKDYGTVAVGAGTPATTFTVSNGGSAASGPLSVVVTGADPNDYAVGTDTCTDVALAAGGSCLVSVSFTPTVQGLRTATLQVTGSPGGAPRSDLLGIGQ
jgi:hypothetical protein